LGYQNSETPQPIVTKFGVDDYVGNMNQHVNTETDRLNGDWGVSRQMGEISLSRGF